MWSAAWYRLQDDHGKTLLLRLPHISKDCDPQVQEFCEQLALQRNAELHSGEAPFVGAAQEVWEREFSINTDGYVSQKCPACGATGVLGGILWSEEVSEERDDDGPTVECVDKTYLSEEFRCFNCGFVAEGRREVLGAGITEEFYETDTRERQFEPEYNNE